MIKGGKGGGHTTSGLKFEKREDIKERFRSLKGYELKGDSLFFKGKEVAHFYKKNKIYKELLEKNNIDWEKLVSKRLLPDEALLVKKSNTLFIIEMKFQSGEGSVDEKLQTCDFKKKQYTKLMSKLGIKVEYVYLLNNWFKQEKYKEVLNYINSVGCHYFFELPLKFLGLPESK